MGKREELRKQLQPLIAGAPPFGDLEGFMLSQCNLPGPRGNLELAWALGDLFATADLGDALWTLLQQWLGLSADEAPTNDPKEFLPFSALQALGAAYANADPARKTQISETIRRAAEDGRWRMREGVAMAFQRIAENDFTAVRQLFSGWMQTANPLEKRAIIAALAHPPILTSADRVMFCFEITEEILSGLATATPQTRKTEGYRVLKQGLEYAISVFVQHLPKYGFPFLRKWAAVDDADVKRIVKSNLGKARLAKNHGDEVKEILTTL